MTLNNIKTMKKDGGFTIVELLIVIVVIGILAAIVIVAYQGVTARANTSKAQSNAVAVQKKAEAYAADVDVSNGAYPATAAAAGWGAAGTLGSQPTGITYVTVPGTAWTAAPTDSKTVQYSSCGGAASTFAGATGYMIGYWDYTQKKTIYVAGGTVSVGSDNSVKPTCAATQSTS